MNDWFKYPDTVPMLRDVHQRFERRADIANGVDQRAWNDDYLADLNCSVDTEDGRISRAMLHNLAADSRAHPGDDDALSKLFWNVLAWGISGDWRHVRRIKEGFVEQRERVLQELRLARDASFEGRVRDAYAAINPLIPHWGPAFTTKFLAFTSSWPNHHGVQAIMVDSRVQLAWTILVDSEGGKDLTTKRYTKICNAAAHLASDSDWTPEELEARLFVFGQTVGTYQNWAETKIAALQDKLGEDVPVGDVLVRVVAGSQPD